MAVSQKAATLVFFAAPLWTQQNQAGEKVVSSPFPLLATGVLPHNPAFILLRNDVHVANIGLMAIFFDPTAESLNRVADRGRPFHYRTF